MVYKYPYASQTGLTLLPALPLELCGYYSHGMIYSYTCLHHKKYKKPVQNEAKCVAHNEMLMLDFLLTVWHMRL